MSVVLLSCVSRRVRSYLLVIRAGNTKDAPSFLEIRFGIMNWDYALFAELGSSPASMASAKAVDAFGLLPGHCKQYADAEQAYTQAAYARQRGSVCRIIAGLPLGSASRTPSFLYDLLCTATQIRVRSGKSTAMLLLEKKALNPL